ncbi:MAG: type I-U CRISPR-associated protein Cas5/Cas6 [Armatimonadetes bacterium]|nr:type I-U CRISPR-associated protein Cas5/Cas6 [Armatimonadota bacterium]
MIRHLCISATFLDPLFHGQRDDGPEWPPSPMRLFKALLAGARAGCRERDWSDVKEEAYRWLERQEPPLIIAPAVRLQSPCTYFVPNNDGDKVLDRQDRLTSKVARPHRLVDGKTIYYVWPIQEKVGHSARSHAGIICKEARHVLALGWGIDQVVGSGQILSDSEVAALPGQLWRARSTYRPGMPTWRVPTADSLEDVERVHQSFLQRIAGRQYNPPLKPSRFASVVYISTVTLPPRSYAIFELPDGVAFRQENASQVAAMMRSLACNSAKMDTHEFPGGSEIYVAGHITNKQGDTPLRFSYLPLPTIGHEHADGMIRRLLIAEPYDGKGSHARWAQQRLCNQALRDTGGNERGVLLDLWRSSSKAMVRRYVAESKSWSTVTPVILPGFDDGKQAKAEKLLLQATEQAGLRLEAVTDLALRKAPFWDGSQHPRQYQRPQYLKHLPAWHVRLVFREPVPGPLALGAGRHCGLGLFRREEEPQT